MLYLQIFIFLLCLTALGYYLLSLYAAIAFFRSPVKENGTKFAPPVTILKPLCGLDWQGYDCLASFCQQDYPQYQIVFCVQAQDDPSVAIIERLKQDFPQQEISLAIGKISLGINPKINNLANGFASAKYDFLVLSDSDIQVKSNYLKDIIQLFENPEVGVVTCLYRSVTTGWLASFEALDIATTFLPKILTARLLEGMAFAFGSTIALRRETLEKIGGFASMAD
ncbi:MAG: glycosyltransferase, partial [Microcystaceae cyanobacterium]